MVTDSAVAPTCTETGLTAGDHCSRCDYHHAQEIVPALGHDMVTDPAVEPTCTATGLTEGDHCSRCDYHHAQETVPALGHDMITDSAISPTCTETGLTEGDHCSRCDYHHAQEIIPALGHDMITDPAVEPTCTETGLTEGDHCSRCDYHHAQETVPALGHDMVTDPAIVPTCTETGLTAGDHCSRCDYHHAQEIVPALGHDIVTDPAVEPTCTETGLTAGDHCSRCDYHHAQEIVPALGHDMVTDSAVAPTCTETGLTEGKHCSVCYKVLTTQQILPATGHTMGTPVRENETVAQPGIAGAYDLVTYCTICGTELSRYTHSVPALPLDYNAWKTYAAEAKGVTVTDEAGIVYQTMTVANGDLAYVPTGIGDTVKVYVNEKLIGEEPEALCIRAGDVVRAEGGACVFRIQTIRTYADDGSDIWAHVNWVAFGDSITDDGHGQAACAAAPNKYWRVLEDETGINVYNGTHNGVSFAVGSSGYYRRNGMNFAERVTKCIPHDADVVTVFGSVNDWISGRVDHQTASSIPYAKTMTGSYVNLQSATSPEWDTLADGTLAGYINATWEEIHRQAPLAKIVIICPQYYVLDRGSAERGRAVNAGFLSVMRLLKWCYDGWIENRDAADWLSWVSFSYDPDTGKWLHDTSIIDTDPDSPTYGGSLDFRQIDPLYGGSIDYSFADYYTYDASVRGAAYGHPNDRYHRAYLSVKFAQILCNLLDTDQSSLPVRYMGAMAR